MIINDLLLRGTIDDICDWIYKNNMPNIYKYY